MTIGYKIWSIWILAAIIGLLCAIEVHPKELSPDEIKPTFVAIEDGKVLDGENCWVLAEKPLTIIAPQYIVKVNQKTGLVLINMPHYAAIYCIVGKAVISFDDNDIVLTTGECCESTDLIEEYYSFINPNTQKIVIEGPKYSVWAGQFDVEELMSAFKPNKLEMH